MGKAWIGLVIGIRRSDNSKTSTEDTMTDLHFREVPVTSTSQPEYKSVLPSVFFGFFAAPFQAHNAKKRGLKGSRYWAAAGISTFASFALLVLVVLALGVIGSNASSSSGASASNGQTNTSGSTTTQPSDTTGTSTGSCTDTTPAYVEQLDTLNSDSMITVLQALESERANAYRTGNNNCFVLAETPDLVALDQQYLGRYPSARFIVTSVEEALTTDTGGYKVTFTMMDGGGTKSSLTRTIQRVNAHWMIVG